MLDTIRATTTDFKAEDIPSELRVRPQWVVWTYEKKKDELAKVLYDAKRPGRRAKSNTPATWTSFEQAERAYRAHPKMWAGVGYVFSADDPYCGIDLDGCLDPSTGEVAPDALAIIDDLDTYCEISPSGTGFKLFCRGVWPKDARNKVATTWWPDGKPAAIDKPEAIEVFDRLKYFTITGKAWSERRTCECRQHQLDELHTARMATDSPTSKPNKQASLTNDELVIGGARAAENPITARGPEKYPECVITRASEKPTAIPAYLADAADDGKEELAAGGARDTSNVSDIELLGFARNGPGKERFIRLFDNGDTSAYPSASEADLSLCNDLAFYCGPNPDRIGRLFSGSALNREK